MATHSSVLAWRIPWTGDSPLGCKELDPTEGTEHTHRKNSGLPSGTSGKEPPANAEYVRDMGSIPGLGRPPWRKAWLTHSSILAYRITWTEESGGLQSMGFKKSDTTEAA